MTTTAAGIVEVYVFRRAQSGTEYLVLRRSKNETLYPGIWQIVTGTIEPGETAVRAALRELEEETGCAPVRMWTVPGSGSYYDPVADVVQMCPQFAVEVLPDAAARLSAEHEELCWRSPGDAAALLLWPSQKSAIDLVQTFIVQGPAGAGPTEIHLMSERNSP